MGMYLEYTQFKVHGGDLYRNGNSEHIIILALFDREIRGYALLSQLICLSDCLHYDSNLDSRSGFRLF